MGNEKKDKTCLRSKERQMANHSCLNVTSGDDQMYSSPMPFIGLYTAAATLVCFLFIVRDVFHGLRNRKPWIPCRFFSLNSLTLTLLAIATKFPVDLTTSMPSAQDQLSKLSGTILLCVSMGFFSPSLATQSDYEHLSNMVSLSIFVVTVVVNVCIQMVTGVIFTFIVEHIIIMSCMLLLLMVMWYTFEIDIPSQVSLSPRIGDGLKKIDHQNPKSRSMMQRLNSVYVSNYAHNPELEVVDTPWSFSIFILSSLSAVVLFQAVLRSLVIKEVDFRCGISDYKWSMWVVVVAQILTVIVGSSGILFRWSLSFNVSTDYLTEERYVCFSLPSWVLSTSSKRRIMLFFKISKWGFMLIFQTITRNVLEIFGLTTFAISALGIFLSLIFKIPYLYMIKLTKKYFCKQEGTTRMNKKQWLQRNCEEDIKRLMEQGKRDSPTHLVQLLSETPPSEEYCFTNKIPTASTEKRVSCLLLVVFIRVTTIILPNTLGASLIHTIDEAFGIIYFIDTKINDIDYKNKRSCELAKELWIHRRNTCHWFHRRIIKPSVKKYYSEVSKKSMDGGLQSQSQNKLDVLCALGIIEDLKKTGQAHHSLIDEDSLALDEMETVYEFIIGKERRRMYSSINELYSHIKQLSVDMLHYFLSQLPLAIFKHLIEGPIQQFQERERFVIKLLWKLEQLEDKIHWIFPDGTGITSLITTEEDLSTNVHHSLTDGTSFTSLINTQVSTVATQCVELLESNEDADVACRVIEDDEIQELV